MRFKYVNLISLNPALHKPHNYIHVLGQTITLYYVNVKICKGTLSFSKLTLSILTDTTYIESHIFSYNLMKGCHSSFGKHGQICKQIFNILYFGNVKSLAIFNCINLRLLFFSNEGYFHCTPFIISFVHSAFVI